MMKRFFFQELLLDLIKVTILITNYTFVVSSKNIHLF